MDSTSSRAVLSADGECSEHHLGHVSFGMMILSKLSSTQIGSPDGDTPCVAPWSTRNSVSLGAGAGLEKIQGLVLKAFQACQDNAIS